MGDWSKVSGMDQKRQRQRSQMHAFSVKKKLDRDEARDKDV